MGREIYISIEDQTLTYKKSKYKISSSKFGLGSQHGSFRTPVGDFIIYKKIGYNEPINTIFKARKAIGVLNKENKENKDLILSRIIWLEGLQICNNNTRERYIYIHGTNHEHCLGSPASYGCIRMYNSDIIELFSLIEEGDRVKIS